MTAITSPAAADAGLLDANAKGLAADVASHRTAVLHLLCFFEQRKVTEASFSATRMFATLKLWSSTSEILICMTLTKKSVTKVLAARENS